ncbi:metal ABC transporter permease [Pontibacter roseus]|uniref:metal ABC transporter permease n=1 Tax=Pontibacter roseus TaxID=336989 RepID=UPI000475768F|nr:metal ABC transporter permease [Pontibacter roseus]
MNAFWIILTGSLVATCCSLLGCYLILRRMAMVGDAISHAVLPGIVIAFLLTGSRDSVPMLIGAGLLGVLTTFLIEFFHRYARVQADAAIGVTFTWLFAIGIILISVFAGQVDLDQDCVLYGEIAYVPLDLWITESGLSMGPRTVWTLSITTLLIILFIVLGYKELFLTTFDPAFAAAIGISTSLWYYLLMTAVSLTTVASFESVGAILVVAFLVAPPATAYLLTDNFKVMLVLSVLLGILASVGGYYLAVWLDGSIAGAIATVTGMEFLLAILFSPSRGLLIRRKQLQPV